MRFSYCGCKSHGSISYCSSCRYNQPSFGLANLGTASSPAMQKLSFQTHFATCTEEQLQWLFA